MRLFLGLMLHAAVLCAAVGVALDLWPRSPWYAMACGLGIAAVALTGLVRDKHGKDSKGDVR